MMMQYIFLLLIVDLMLSVKIEANKSTEKVSKENLDDKKLLKRNGEVADQQSSVDANTQALWEAYWKQYPENAWDATPDYYRNGNRGKCPLSIIYRFLFDLNIRLVLLLINQSIYVFFHIANNE